MKKVVSLMLALVMVFSMMPHALAASEAATTAADKLNELGLFSGTGTNEDGTPNYDLDRAPTRQEAITMLVKLVGGAEEAGKGGWETPFTDVDDWAKNWVGYAYAKGLTVGTSATTFGANDMTTAAQYLTFILKALGYDATSDFSWDKAWELSDQIGLTNGEYKEDTAFTRGDVAIISYSALSANLKGQEKTLAESLGLTMEEQEPEDTTTEQTPDAPAVEEKQEEAAPEQKPDDPADYYPGTKIKTFTAVTGVKSTDYQKANNMTSSGRTKYDWYEYKNGGKYAESYREYMRSIGEAKTSFTVSFGAVYEVYYDGLYIVLHNLSGPSDFDNVAVWISPDPIRWW